MDYDKIYTLIYNCGMRLNSIYMKIKQLIKLKDFLDQYHYKIFQLVYKSVQSTILEKF